MRAHPGFALALSAALAGACTQPAEEPEAPPPAASPQAQPASTAPVIGYACESGQTVEVQYVDDATARVAYKGATADLRLTPSGSGARYVGAEWEWWSATRDGVEQATLGRLGPNAEVGVTVLERCTRPTSGGAAPGPQPATTAPIAGSPCRGPQLQLAAEGSDAGAGNRETVLSLRNVGSQACTLQGHPGVVLLDAQSRPLTAVRSERIDASGGPAPAGPGAAVTLEPQAKAYFGLRWNVVPNEAQGQRTCPTAARIQVTAPGDTSPTSLNQSFTPCGGRVSVTPLRTTPEPQPATPAGP